KSYSKDLIDRNFMELIPKRTRLAIRKQLSMISPKVPVTTYDQRNVNPGGTVTWQEWTNRGIFNDAGKLIEIQSVGRDITQRKQAELALRRSEKQYRAVVETQNELICRHLPDCTFTFVNEAHCRYFGLKREELIGRNFLSFTVKADHKTVLKHIARLSSEHPVNTHVERVLLPGGEQRWQEWSNRGVFDEWGRLVEIQSVGRDITQRKKAELALKGSEKELRAQKAILEQKNIALREILDQIEIEKKEIKDDVIASIDNLLSPILQKLKSEGGRSHSKYINLLERSLEGMASSFGRKISQNNLKLTPREIDICNMIKNGLSSKEIAGLLYLSLKTINRHRQNIRRKCNIRNQKINLATFFQSL
ncbi:MAG: PAS domain S-box protein, partial [Candidatus Erginobacter occultus]|nr:PAS domain S-box protein [Candidatus Erginobacter occultus]